MRHLLFLIILYFAFPYRVFADPMIPLINEQRKINNVASVKSNEILAQTAQRKACDLLRYKFWSHNYPSGESWYAVFIQYGYKGTLVGENLNRNYISDEDSINDFMNSPTHKSVILNPKFVEVGIGRCGEFIVQHFGGKK